MMFNDIVYDIVYCVRGIYKCIAHTPQSTYLQKKIKKEEKATKRQNCHSGQSNLVMATFLVYRSSNKILQKKIGK